MLLSPSVSHLCLCPIWEGGLRPEHTPVPPTLSAETGRHTNREGAVGDSLVPELANRRMGGTWGALQQGPLAQSECSQSCVLALLSRVFGVPWRYSSTGSPVACSPNQQSFTST